MSWRDRDEVIIRVLTVMGKRDHYAHFMLDFMIPVWMWLNQNDLATREDFTVYYWDGAASKFAPMIDAFFTCKVRHISTLSRHEGIERVMLLGLESHNRKMMSIGLSHYIGDVQKFIRELQGYAFDRLPVDIQKCADKIVMVRREVTGEDRGGGRRSTSNEDELATALSVLAVGKGLEFEEVSLAGMRFAKQVELFANAKVVVAQHGASLVNLFWMRKGSILLEYHWNGNEAYRKREFCKFLGQPQHFHVSGGRPEPSVVEAPVMEIVKTLSGNL